MTNNEKAEEIEEVKFSTLDEDEELKDVVFSSETLDDRFAHLFKGPVPMQANESTYKATQSTASTDRFTNIKELQSRLWASRLNG